MDATLLAVPFAEAAPVLTQLTLAECGGDSQQLLRRSKRLVAKHLKEMAEWDLRRSAHNRKEQRRIKRVRAEMRQKEVLDSVRDARDERNASPIVAHTQEDESDDEQEIIASSPVTDARCRRVSPQIVAEPEMIAPPAASSRAIELVGPIFATAVTQGVSTLQEELRKLEEGRVALMDLIMLLRNALNSGNYTDAENMLIVDALVSGMEALTSSGVATV